MSHHKKKDEITQFLRRLDQALVESLAEKGAPLVFAGVDFING